MKKGFISVDFMFTFVAVILLTLFLVMLTVSLCLMEVTQYITYAAAREYFVSHQSRDAQQSKSIARFNELNSRFFPPSISPSWFSIEKFPDFILQNPNETARDRYLFIGLRAKFISKVLKINSPLFGSGDDDFEAELGSYLGREVSTEECQSFFKNYSESKLTNLFQQENRIRVKFPRACPSGAACVEC